MPEFIFDEPDNILAPQQGRFEGNRFLLPDVNIPGPFMFPQAPQESPTGIAEQLGSMGAPSLNDETGQPGPGGFGFVDNPIEVEATWANAKRAATEAFAFTGPGAMLGWGKVTGLFDNLFENIGKEFAQSFPEFSSSLGIGPQQNPSYWDIPDPYAAPGIGGGVSFDPGPMSNPEQETGPVSEPDFGGTGTPGVPGSNMEDMGEGDDDANDDAGLGGEDV